MKYSLRIHKDETKTCAYPGCEWKEGDGSRGCARYGVYVNKKHYCPKHGKVVGVEVDITRKEA